MANMLKCVAFSDAIQGKTNPETVQIIQQKTYSNIKYRSCIPSEKALKFVFKMNSVHNQICSSP